MASSVGMDALVNAAFPTLSASANLPKKSIFDVENEMADSDVKIIAANAQYGLYPINEKRGKVRAGYIVLNPPVLEIHRSQKDLKAGKVAKYFVNLEEVFNVCLLKEPFQMKSDCVSIMDMSETFYIKPTDTEFSVKDWFEYILEKCRALRSAKFVRPVFREEFFEAAWDVYLARRPKLKKNYTKYVRLDDLVAKLPELEGRRRLCIQSASILIFQTGATPTANVDVPFDKRNFINLPSHVISSYGNQEKCFILRTGRFSEIGSGEMYMLCESHPGAKAMHDAVMDILARETERRKAQGLTTQSWLTSTTRAKKKGRDRRENPEAAGPTDVQKSDSSMRLRIGTTQSNAPPSRKNSSALVNALATSHTVNAPKGAAGDAAAAAELARKAKAGSFTCKKSSLASLFPFRLGKLSAANAAAAASATATPGELHSPISAVAPANLALSQRDYHGGSSASMGCGAGGAMAPRLASTPTSARAGGSGILNGVQLERMLTIGQSMSIHTNANCGEDYMTYDAHDKNNSLLGHCGKSMTIAGGMADDGGGSSRKASSSAFSGIFANNAKQFSKSSSIAASDSRQRMSVAAVAAGASSSLAVGAAVDDEKDYMNMDENMASSAELYPMPEVHSFISNSPEGCWSPHSLEGASNAPRAYSVGANSKPLPLANTSTSNASQRQRASNEEVKRSSPGSARLRFGSASGGRTPPASRRATNSSPRQTPPTVREELADAAPSTSHTASTASSATKKGASKRVTSIKTNATRAVRRQRAGTTAGAVTSSRSSNEPPATPEAAAATARAGSKTTRSEALTESSDNNNASKTPSPKTTIAAVANVAPLAGGGGARDASTLPSAACARGSDAPSASAAAADDDFSELRKRAHSVGSKSWKKPSFLKLAGKRVSARFGAAQSPAGAAADATTPRGGSGGGGDLPAELRTRADSATSGGVYVGGVDRRRNSSRLSTSTTTNRSVGSAHPDSQDHVEFDFDRGSCPSIDSPSNRSRNSSLGVQLPSSIRAALDLALTSQRSFVVATDGHADRYLESLYDDLHACQSGSSGTQLARKRSVPDGIPADGAAAATAAAAAATPNALLLDTSAVVATSAKIDSYLRMLNNNNNAIAGIGASQDGALKTTDADEYVMMDVGGAISAAAAAVSNAAAASGTPRGGAGTAAATAASKLKSTNSTALSAARNCFAGIGTIMESTSNSSSGANSHASSSRDSSPRDDRAATPPFTIGSDGDEDEEDAEAAGDEAVDELESCRALLNEDESDASENAPTGRRAFTNGASVNESQKQGEAPTLLNGAKNLRASASNWSTRRDFSPSKSSRKKSSSSCASILSRQMALAENALPPSLNGESAQISPTRRSENGSANHCGRIDNATASANRAESGDSAKNLERARDDGDDDYGMIVAPPPPQRKISGQSRRTRKRLPGASSTTDGASNSSPTSVERLRNAPIVQSTLCSPSASNASINSSGASPRRMAAIASSIAPQRGMTFSASRSPSLTRRRLRSENCASAGGNGVASR